MEVLSTHGVFHCIYAALSVKGWNVTTYFRIIFRNDRGSLSCTYPRELCNKTLLQISSKFHM